jgi:hypothetical protein
VDSIVGPCGGLQGCGWREHVVWLRLVVALVVVVGAGGIVHVRCNGVG